MIMNGTHIGFWPTKILLIDINLDLIVVYTFVAKMQCPQNGRGKAASREKKSNYLRPKREFCAMLPCRDELSYNGEMPQENTVRNTAYF